MQIFHLGAKSGKFAEPAKKMIKFVIKGKPKPLKRHRTSKGRTYDPSAKDKRDFALQCATYAPKLPLTGALTLLVRFYMPRPKKHFRTGKFAGILRDDAPILHSGRPDISNLVKFVEDALNGIFWKDDSQIVILHASKYYSKTPRTEIRICEVK
jgi:Holliday junction resolvase RusA-like endonuclease